MGLRGDGDAGQPCGILKSRYKHLEGARALEALDMCML